MAIIVERPAAERSDGELLLWILVWSELIVFGCLLVGFLVMSALHPESSALGRLQLNGRLASVNTLVLLASGWLAAEAARADWLFLRRAALVGAAGLGFLFSGLKILEYAGEIHLAGDARLSGFFELYALITGFHLAHVVFLGLLMLVVARRAERSQVVLVTTLWHVIDLVWLTMFPLLYLG